MPIMSMGRAMPRTEPAIDETRDAIAQYKSAVSEARSAAEQERERTRSRRRALYITLLLIFGPLMVLASVVPGNATANNHGSSFIIGLALTLWGLHMLLRSVQESR
jgi:cytochrome c biogenesis protein CcdA